MTSTSAFARACAIVAFSALAVGQVAPAPAQEQPVAAEKNPPGDIPDSQVFIAYASPKGFGLRAPEGWSRVDKPDGVVFSDKYNAIDVTVAKRETAPTAANTQSREIADLVKNGRAVKITAVKEVTVKSGPALRITYSSNSPPNPVTNKQIRLENERYIYFRNGKTVTLDFAAPFGADNADQWNLMSNAFHWS